MYYVPKISTFLVSILDPIISLEKSKTTEKTPKTDVHKNNDSSIQIHLIWFFNFSAFGAFVWKSNPKKAR